MSTRINCAVGVAVIAAAMCNEGPAKADSPVYADVNGMCGGKTPCYTTIEDAIRAASDPDGAGPLFAEVFVFPGTYAEIVTLSAMGGGVHGDLQLTTVDASGAPTPGTAAIEPPFDRAIRGGQLPFEWRIIIDGFVVTSPDASAIDVLGTSDITIVNVVAHDAGQDSSPAPVSPDGTGIRVTSTLGAVTVRNCTAQNCRAFGIFASNDAADLTIDAVVAEDNGVDGIVAGTSQRLIVRDSSASGNGVGMFLQSFRDISVQGCALEKNIDGIRAFADDAVTIESTTAMDNLGEGIYVESENGTVTIDRLTAARNNRNVHALTAGDIVISDSSSMDSNSRGFHLTAGENITLDSLFSRKNPLGYSLFTPGDVQIANSAAEECVIGFRIESNGSVNVDRLTAVDGADDPAVIIGPSSAADFVGNVFIQNSLVANNGNSAGILLHQLAPSGSHVIAGSIICGNPGGGLFQTTDSTAVIDARGNWWGDVTGPKRPNKPGGLGDGIEPGGGEILVDPWIDQITAVASHQQATLANDVTVRFQFRHSGSEMFLGEGPGAVGARRPFVITSDNGTVKSHDGRAGAVSAFITKEKGTLEVIAEGAVQGPAKIELSGLCFPTRSVTVEVIPIPVPLPPNPTPVAGATPNANANEPSEPKRATPFCGAGVPMMAELSAVGLLAARLSPGPRRRNRRR